MWSPRSPTLHIGLSAQRLTVAKKGGVWPGKLAVCDVIHCAEAPEAEQTEPWRPALTALARMLAEPSYRKPRLHIVLSGRFVRWQLLPWRPELTQPKEVSAYASMRFRETFGKAADDWQVLHSVQPPGKTVPACAVDAALMEALRNTCEAAGARLAAVTPYFACAFDRWRNTLVGKTVWFGLIETDCMSLGLLQGDNWLGLRTQRLDGDWRDALPGMMAQIGISAGLADTSAPLYLAGSAEPPATSAKLSFVWLQPKAQAAPAMAGCRMALGV